MERKIRILICKAKGEANSAIRILSPVNQTEHVIAGTANIREINKTLHWELPTDGPKTLSGLILEYLESFPDGNAGLTIGRYRLEILELEGNVVRSVRVRLASD